MDLLTLLIILLLVLVVLGGGGYYQGWYGPGPAVPGVFGLIIAIVLIFILLRAFRMF